MNICKTTGIEHCWEDEVNTAQNPSTRHCRHCSARQVQKVSKRWVDVKPINY